MKKRKRIILYYTDNTLDGTNLGEAVRSRLQAIGNEYRIISVSQRPINFGENIVVGKRLRSVASILEQILTGLAVVEDSEYVFFAEHDCLYHPSHWVEQRGDVIAYDLNYYRCTPRGYARHVPAKYILSMASGRAGTLRRAMQQKLDIFQQGGRAAVRCLEPGRGAGCDGIDIVEYEADWPSLDIRHEGSFSRQVDLPVARYDISGWGPYETIRATLRLINKPRIKIGWLVDVPGWAWDNRARIMASKLPHYRHDIICVCQESHESLKRRIAAVDILMVDNVRAMPCCFSANMKPKIVLGLRSQRAISCA